MILSKRFQLKVNKLLFVVSFYKYNFRIIIFAQKSLVLLKIIWRKSCRFFFFFSPFLIKAALKISVATYIYAVYTVSLCVCVCVCVFYGEEITFIKAKCYERTSEQGKEKMEDTASRATVNLRKTREIMKRCLKIMYKYVSENGFKKKNERKKLEIIYRQKV